jgi:hypothetical protein
MQSEIVEASPETPIPGSGQGLGCTTNIWCPIAEAAVELDSEPEAGPAGDSPVDSALVPMALSVVDLLAERDRALSARPAGDSPVDSASVPMVHSAGDSLADSAPESVRVPVVLRAGAVVASALWVPAANPSAESLADLVADSAVDSSGESWTTQLKTR